MTAEAEVKFEISEEMLPSIEQIFSKNNFVFLSENELEDIYIDKKQSEMGGWDFDRIRKYGSGKIVFTSKKWVKDSQGERTRLEDERELSESEFADMISKNPPIQSLNKLRKKYKGQVNGLDTIVDMDDLVVNGKHYYFIELEQIVPVEQSAASRNMLKEWVRENISADLAKEAPTMLDFIMSL